MFCFSVLFGFVCFETRSRYLTQFGLRLLGLTNLLASTSPVVWTQVYIPHPDGFTPLLILIVFLNVKCLVFSPGIIHLSSPWAPRWLADHTLPARPAVSDHLWVHHPLSWRDSPKRVPDTRVFPLDLGSSKEETAPGFTFQNCFLKCSGGRGG